MSTGLLFSGSGTHAWFSDKEENPVNISANWQAIRVIPGDFYIPGDDDNDDLHKVEVTVTGMNMVFPFNLGVIEKKGNYPVNIQVIVSEMVRLDGGDARRPPIIQSNVVWDMDNTIITDFLISFSGMHHLNNQTPKTTYGGLITIIVSEPGLPTYEIEINIELVVR